MIKFSFLLIVFLEIVIGMSCADAAMDIKVDVAILGLNLNVSSNTVVLNDNIRLLAVLDPSVFTDAEPIFQIKRVNDVVWHDIEKNLPGDNCDYVAKIAGHFSLRAKINILGVEIMSDEKQLEVKFPDYNTIISDTFIRAMMEQQWSITKDYTRTTNNRQERGFIITYNTADATYNVDKKIIYAGQIIGDVSPINNPISDPIPQWPTENPNFNDSPIYEVATFHTHTPTFHLTLNGYGGGNITSRPVGPSTGKDSDANTDNNIRHCLGIVYDYLPQNGIDIPLGWPIDSPAGLYQSGPVRRITPP